MTTELLKKFEVQCKKHSRNKKDFKKYFVVDDKHVNDGINKEPIRSGIATHEVIRRIIQKGVMCLNKCKHSPTEIALALKFSNYSWIHKDTFEEVFENEIVIAYAIVRKTKIHFVVTVRIDTDSELQTISIPEVNYEE